MPRAPIGVGGALKDVYPTLFARRVNLSIVQGCRRQGRRGRIHGPRRGAKGASPEAVFRAVRDGAGRVANLQAGASDLAVNLDRATQLDSAPRVQPPVGPT